MPFSSIPKLFVSSLTIIVCFFVLLPTDIVAFDKHKSNTILNQKGYTLSIFGNGLRDSNGTVYRKYGNVIKDSNGEIWELYGNSIKRKSDSKTCRVFGRSIKCEQ